MTTHQGNISPTIDRAIILRNVAKFDVKTESGINITIYHAEEVRIPSTASSSQTVKGQDQRGLMKRLPVELRQIIWELCIPEVRCFEWEEVYTGDDNSEDLKARIMVAVPSSTVLHVCHDSRETTLRASGKALDDFLASEAIDPVLDSHGQLYKLSRDRICLDLRHSFACFPRDKVIRFGLYPLLSFYYMQARPEILWGPGRRDEYVDTESIEVTKSLYLLP